jgi:hypothetical protein
MISVLLTSNSNWPSQNPIVIPHIFTLILVWLPWAIFFIHMVCKKYPIPNRERYFKIRKITLILGFIFSSLEISLFLIFE